MKKLRMYGTHIRINNLELCKNFNTSEEDKLQIVCWQPMEMPNHETCFVVCEFIGDVENGFDVKSVRDRIVSEKVDQKTLTSLIKIGFNILSEVDELC